MKRTLVLETVLMLGLVASLGCGGGSSSTLQNPGGGGGGTGMTIASVYDATIVSLRAGHADSDGDGIPDDVETTLLHTDPHNPDSDGDGIFDHVEIFGDKTWGANDRVPDKNGNGTIAALEADDDADGKNDGDLVDSDQDGIPNRFEYYGYTYDGLSGKPVLWTGDHSVRYFKTDPNQRSTDQDPFDDRTEVSGTNMDVSVLGPGDLPMVPALPEIVVRLEGYRVTLNQEITVSRGRTLSQETTWDATTSATDSRTREDNWEVGVEAEVGFSFPGVSASVTAHANYGGSIANTHETSNSRSQGGSLASAEEWSQATTTNPNEAARMKLFLKVYNHGTACASNVLPTLTMRIGGHNVATFQPGEGQIILLEPGGSYPSVPGVYWVVDTTQSGRNIMLTLNELRALESGAPVSITMTQMAADVMRLNPSTGAYERMGDWNEYIARCKAVCADLYFDLGDGNFAHSLVYADGRPLAPKVTLGDAFLWGIGGTLKDAQGSDRVGFSYRDMDGLVNEKSMAGWSVCLDGGTYTANGLVKGEPLPDRFNLFDLRLNPNSVIVAKAPRVLPADISAPEPDIFYAYYDPSSASVNAVVGDYNGVVKVEFIGKDNEVRAMKPDLPGSSFYVYHPLADAGAYPQGYAFSGTERVRVTNTQGHHAEQTLTGIYVTPGPTAPSIEWAVVNWVSSATPGTPGKFFLETKVVGTPGMDLKVQLFPDYRHMNSPLTEHQPLTLVPVTDGFGPDRSQVLWCSLERFASNGPTVDLNLFANMLIVATYETNTSLMAQKAGTTFVADFPYHVGQVDLYSYYGWYWDDDWYQDALDLENSNIWRFAWEEGDAIPWPGLTHELWFWYQAGGWRMYMRETRYAKYTGALTFDAITRDAVAAAPLAINADYGPVAPGDIFLMQTSKGRYAKMQILDWVGYDPSGVYNTALRCRVKWVTFNEPGVVN